MSGVDAELAWKEGIPWMVPAAVEWLANHIRPDFVAFEWGAGGSTVWLARRVERLVSVEHKKGWYDKVYDRLAREELADKVTLLHVGRDKGETEYGDYIAVVESFGNDEFNLIVVDGRERRRCIQAAAPKLKPGGILVLDDPDKAHYRDARDLLDRWRWKCETFRRRGDTAIYRKPR